MTKAAPGPSLFFFFFFHLLQLLLFPLHVAPVHPARYYGQIAENSPPGTLVDGVQLPVACPGAAPDLNVTLKGDYATDFKIVHYRGHREHRGHLGLVSVKSLDREFIAMYELTVELCQRRGAVQVEVSDQNDNIPRFTSGNKTVEVDELTPLGAEVARFDAKDEDAELNGRVTFYASPESHLLHVVPQTGQVRLIGSLLGVSHVSVRLYVKDNGDVALISAPVFLRVNVRSSGRAQRQRSSSSRRRERRPRAVSEELSYTVTVPDHGRVGELVFTVPDHRFEQRWFEVISEADSPVQIERDSGRLYLARSLREPAEVVVKVQNLRGKKICLFNFVRKKCKNCANVMLV